ncbi:MAG: twin-arginine translocase TatA/TatE family subunit [Actinobacteria bacterium]|nr:twin-arginine translocase TatA/TatE family subunit [Actinomycetota bacterium]
MPQIGPLEILMLAAVALIVFGPQKLPEIARSLGRFMSEMRRMASEVRSEFSLGLDDDSDDEPAPGGDEPVADEDSSAIEDAAPKPRSEES